MKTLFIHIKSLLSRLAGTGLSLLVALIVTRNFGSTSAGEYYVAIAIITGISSLLLFGDRIALLKSSACSPGERIYLRDSLVTCLFIRACILSILVIAVSLFIDSFKIQYMLTLLACGTLFAFILTVGTYYNAEDDQTKAFFVMFGLPPLALLLSIWLLYLFDKIDSTVIAGWIFSAYMLASVVLYIILDLSLGTPSASSLLPSRTSVMISGSLWFTYARNWAITFILGYLASIQEVGVFNIALRIVLVATIINSVIDAQAAPKLAKKFQANETTAVCQAYCNLGLLAAITLFTPLLLLQTWVLNFFGPDFSQANDVLVLLIVGHALALAAGPAGYLLLMQHQERSHLTGVIAGLAIQVIIALLLIGNYGATGAAIAFSAGLVTEKVFHIVLCWKHCHVKCFPDLLHLDNIKRLRM